jgi:hypothetical protein
MADPILLNPDNRLLGSSTGDLSHYGGQLDTGVVIRPAAPDTGSESLSGVALTAAGGVAASGITGAPGQSIAPAEAAPTLADSGAGSASALLFGPALQPFEPIQISPAAVEGAGVTIGAPGVPSGFLPGAGAPQPVLPAASAMTEAVAPPPGETGAVLPVLPGADAIVLPTAVAVGTVATLLDAVEAAALPLVTGAVDGISATVATAGQATGALAETLLDGVGTTLGALGDVAPPLAGGVVDGVTTTLDVLGDATGPVAGPVFDLLGATVDSVGDVALPLAGGVVDGLAMTLGAVGSGAASLVENVTGGVADLAGAAGDSLADLPGSDPLGGVATLVGLVSVSDLFDLQTSEAPMPETTAASPGFGVLDTLIDDLPDALLGGDHDAGLFDHLGDTHHPFGL